MHMKIQIKYVCVLHCSTAYRVLVGEDPSPIPMMLMSSWANEATFASSVSADCEVCPGSVSSRTISFLAPARPCRLNMLNQKHAAIVIVSMAIGHVKNSSSLSIWNARLNRVSVV